MSCYFERKIIAMSTYTNQKVLIRSSKVSLAIIDAVEEWYLSSPSLVSSELFRGGSRFLSLDSFWWQRLSCYVR